MTLHHALDADGERDRHHRRQRFRDGRHRQREPRGHTQPHRQPMHGYEITKQIAELTNSCCSPSEGSLYPVLKEFTEAGLVSLLAEVVSGRERKVYTLTPKGEQAWQVASRAWREVADYILKAT